jgi:septal ring factor EnvC (AmiA/AmiB activator)
MANKKLPAYFKEYLDEKFDHTFDKIKGVKNDVCDVQKEVAGVKREMKKMNGSLTKTINKVSAISKEKDKVVPQVERNRKRILAIVLVIAFGTLFWVKESRDVGLSVIAKIISLL